MKQIKEFYFPILSILIISFIMTLLNVFNISVNSFFYLLTTSLIVFIYSFKNSKKIYNKTIYKSLKTGLIFIGSFILIGLLFQANFNFYSVIFWIIILLFSILGAVLAKILAIYEKK